MPIRLFKSFKVGKNFRINLSKSGLSTSSKIGPMTINSKGRTTMNLPGTGISAYSQSNKKSSLETQLIVWIVVAIIMIMCCFCILFGWMFGIFSQ